MAEQTAFIYFQESAAPVHHMMGAIFMRHRKERTNQRRTQTNAPHLHTNKQTFTPSPPLHSFLSWFRARLTASREKKKRQKCF